MKVFLSILLLCCVITTKAQQENKLLLSHQQKDRYKLIDVNDHRIRLNTATFSYCDISDITLTDSTISFASCGELPVKEGLVPEYIKLEPDTMITLTLSELTELQVQRSRNPESAQGLLWAGLMGPVMIVLSPVNLINHSTEGMITTIAMGAAITGVGLLGILLLGNKRYDLVDTWQLKTM